MIGIDTSFLVAFELFEHDSHQAARDLAQAKAAEGFAVAPQILAEFLHVVTDPRRFEKPLPMQSAIRRTERWWHSQEVRVVSAGEGAGRRFLDLLRQHHLGRKRLLDTLLAATYLEAGIHVIATTNARDFATFTGLAPIMV